MSPRTGRPKSENPKDIVLKVRIDQQTNEKLMVYCEKYNKTRTEAVRDGILTILEKE